MFLSRSEEYPLDQMIDVAAGRTRADLVLKNANVVNVFTGDVTPGDIAIHGSFIAGIGEYVGNEVIDLKGKYVSPSFIDGHVHVESSMVMPIQYARAVVPHGTGAVVADPHEIANVLGMEGILYMSKSMRGGPLEFYMMLPSCVPSTDLETNGVSLDFLDIRPLMTEDYVLGLAEVMNYPGVIYRDPSILEKIQVALSMGKRIDGHAPELDGLDLNAYVAARITSEHECIDIEEARRKLARGMHIHIREGSTTKNLKALAPLIEPHTAEFCSFVTDDRNSLDLITKGHIDSMIRDAIEFGVDPVLAIKVASLSTAKHYGLQYVGAVAPGYHADIVVLDSLEKINVEMVYKQGVLVAKNGEMVQEFGVEKQPRLRRSVNIHYLEPEDFQVKARGERMNVIGTIPDQVITERLIEEPKVEDGLVVPDIGRDILKVAIIERHNASEPRSVGFVKGLGIKEGAMVSSIAHDSHNIVAVATNDRDLIQAAIQIVRMQGGIALAKDGKVIESLPLPIAGLMSDHTIEHVSERLKDLKTAAQKLGTPLEEPFMAMAFLSLPVIPKLKITDLGLVDVDRFRLIDLFDVPD
ncbi:MAG: Adenine deaminase [Candidatus Thorarchaeota archaeon AB_25]|nr:MAG: Adenine deaminase [Candidatus Thorarchaeota archaeon AB_25]